MTKLLSHRWRLTHLSSPCRGGAKLLQTVPFRLDPKTLGENKVSSELCRLKEAFKPLFWLLRFLSDDHQAAWCMESISMLSLIGRIPLIGVLRAGSGY